MNRNDERRDLSSSASLTSEQFERLIDRLVDGELPAAEYRELLGRIEEVPSRWRHVGLAFLEQQALTAELRHLGTQVSDARPSKSAMASSSDEAEQTDVDRESRSLTSSDSNSVHGDASRGAKRTFDADWLGFIAAGLMGIAVGWLAFGPRLDSRQPLDRNHVVSENGFSTPDRAGRDSGLQLVEGAPSRVGDGHEVGNGWRGPSEMSNPSAPLVFIRDGQIREDGQVGMPIMGDGGFRIPESALSEELLQRLRASGQRVKQHSWQYRPVRLPSGEQYVVPVERVRVQPVNQHWIP